MRRPKQLDRVKETKRKTKEIYDQKIQKEVYTQRDKELNRQRELQIEIKMTRS